MMSPDQGPSGNLSTLLAVVCGKNPGCNQQQVDDGKPRYPFPELASSERLEVQVLTNPSTEDFHGSLQSVDPRIVYLQGELIEGGNEVGSLRWGDVDLSTSDALCGAFGSFLPASVIDFCNPLMLFARLPFS